MSTDEPPVPEIPAAPVPSAPAVIDDTLPGGPRWMHNLGDTPVWVETKSQLAHEMALRGLEPSPRARYEKHDRSPWATPTRLRPGERDPFLHKVPGRSPVTPDRPPSFTPEALPAGSRADTVGTVQTKAGDVRLPTLLIGATDRRLLRSYRTWLHDMQLQSALYCAHCWSGALDDVVKTNISSPDVTMVCRCRIRYGLGDEPFPTLPRARILVSGDAPIPPMAVQTLREYKHFMLRFHLKEALRCLNCWNLGHWDGCHALVLDSSILIECRCTRRIHHGQT